MQRERSECQITCTRFNKLENSLEHKCLEIVFKFIEHLDIMMHVGKNDACWEISYFLLSPALLVKITFGKVKKENRQNVNNDFQLHVRL